MKRITRSSGRESRISRRHPGLLGESKVDWNTLLDSRAVTDTDCHCEIRTVIGNSKFCGYCAGYFFEERQGMLFQ